MRFTFNLIQLLKFLKNQSWIVQSTATPSATHFAYTKLSNVICLVIKVAMSLIVKCAVVAQMLLRFPPLIFLPPHFCFTIFKWLWNAKELGMALGVNPKHVSTDWIIKGDSWSMWAVIDRLLRRIGRLKKGTLSSMGRNRLRRLICLRWLRGHCGQK